MEDYKIRRILDSVYYNHRQVAILIKELVDAEIVKYVYWVGQAFELKAEEIGFFDLVDTIMIQIGEHCEIVLWSGVTYAMRVEGKTLTLKEVKERGK